MYAYAYTYACIYIIIYIHINYTNREALCRPNNSCQHRHPSPDCLVHEIVHWPAPVPYVDRSMPPQDLGLNDPKYIQYLVCGWPTPLKNMKFNGKDEIPYMKWKNKKCAKPPIIYIYYYIIWIWSYMAMNQHLQIGFWGEWTSAMSGRTKMYQGFDPKLYVCCSSLKENTLSWVWNTAFLSLYSWRAQQKHQHSQKIIQLAIITTASPQTHLPGLEINMIKKLTLGGNQEHWTIFED